jgi:hypothetical protein
MDKESAMEKTRRFPWRSLAVTGLSLFLTAVPSARPLGAQEKPGKPDTKVAAEFAKAYGLPEGEDLKWFATPPPPARAAWLRAVLPSFSNLEGGGLFVKWTGGALEELAVIPGGHLTLGDAARILSGFYPQDTEAEAEILGAELPEGDFVVREEASPATASRRWRGWNERGPGRLSGKLP